MLGQLFFMNINATDVVLRLRSKPKCATERKEPYMPLDNISELKRRVPGGKYTLARAVAERARQLQSGATPLVTVRTPNPLSVAIDEIVQGKVSFQVGGEVDQAEAEENQAGGESTGESPAQDTSTDHLLS
jgi:DNA-directed RNA polymerase subunit K/omega